MINYSQNYLKNMKRCVNKKKKYVNKKKKYYNNKNKQIYYKKKYKLNHIKKNINISLQFVMIKI